MVKSFLFAFVCFIQIFSFIKAQAENENSKSLLITEGTYNKLPTREQKKYVKEIRKSYYEFEAVLNKNVNYADISSNKYQFALSFFMNAAVAENEAMTFCVIGGVDFDLSKDQKCPIQKNLCKGEPNKFQCSEIYANVCVNVTPKEEISKRCYEESISSNVNYPLLKDRFEEVYNNVCLDFDNLKKLKQEHVAACHYLGAKLDKLNKPLEEELRERLSSCENSLENLQYENSKLNRELQQCLEKLPKPEVVTPKENFSCDLTGSRVNSMNLSDIGNIQMFKKDSRMVRLLGSTQNVDSINITKEGDNACFTFEVTERAMKRFNESKSLVKKSEFAQVSDGKIKGCTSNGVEQDNGKLFVPALLSHKYNFVTFKSDDSGNCKVGTDLLKKIRADFGKGRGVSSVKE